MKALYVGAGTDMKPLQCMKNIKHFFYIDCQPFSEFGILRSKEWKNGKWTGKYTDGFSRPNFIPRLEKEIAENNIKQKSVDNDTRTYTKGNQTLYYYTNTSVPEHIKRVSQEVPEYDYLIVSGHDPDSAIVNNMNKNMNKKITFVGFHSTYYGIDYEYPENANSVGYRLHTDSEFRQKFKSFHYTPE